MAAKLMRCSGVTVNLSDGGERVTLQSVVKLLLVRKYFAGHTLTRQVARVPRLRPLKRKFLIYRE